MLESLYIKNIAVIEEVSIDFHSGMNVLTGETGAGKSIIIDSIGQLLGQRTKTGLIRTGCDQAFIEGVFSISQEIRDLLDEYGFECEDELVVSKKISSDGKSTIKINYRNASMNLLRNIIPAMIDIHSQFETHTLFDEKKHITFLDTYIGEALTAFMNTYHQQYQEYKKCERKYKELTEEELSDEQLDFYKTQLEEINSLSLEKLDEDELEKEITQLKNFEKTSERIQNYVNYMKGHEVLSSLQSALYELDNIEGEDFAAVHEKMYDLYYSLEAYDDEVMSLYNSLDFDEYRFNELQDIQYRLRRLKRKYGSSIEKILEEKSNLEEKVRNFEHREEVIEELLDQRDKAYKLCLKTAESITKIRQEYGKKFSQAIKKELKDLYLDKVEFIVEVNKCDLNTNGQDYVRFLISTNAGQSLQPLQKVASGGELSRIMLAIKIQMNNNKTIIFDEADTGVSGKVAESIGMKMKELSSNSQVLVITHLAQVAGFADYHYLIQKTVENNNTRTVVTELNENDSILELAKMISGKDVTEESLAHAKKLKKPNME